MQIIAIKSQSHKANVFSIFFTWVQFFKYLSKHSINTQSYIPSRNKNILCGSQHVNEMYWHRIGNVSEYKICLLIDDSQYSYSFCTISTHIISAISEKLFTLFYTSCDMIILCCMCITFQYGNHLPIWKMYFDWFCCYKKPYYHINMSSFHCSIFTYLKVLLQYLLQYC